MIRLLIADDEDLIRVALAQLLELEHDFEVVAQASDGRSAVDEGLRHRPDVAVVDLEMPGLGGIDVATELKRVLPECAVVILTGRGRPLHLQQALVAGASGFVVKGAPASSLADVIRRVRAGQRYVDPALAAEALTIPTSPLTERELEVLRLASSGANAAAIATRTHLAPGTVRNYLAAIQSKLGATDRHHAARIARDAGWL
ncbi:DNA-binding response regulator [Mycetocola zhujimingii]|uniref:DNA-binding response regulator n=1 Tax=Mycetocola zhujimingii TaxID=2079792 RepID=A0A2U1THU8_9MICO|nr:response regulator transcription factor [Mycetocola zhujimingii]PWC08474.1 DNA-binding response regulator [Mycetocola zhujimingii]